MQTANRPTNTGVCLATDILCILEGYDLYSQQTAQIVISNTFDSRWINESCLLIESW